MSHCSGQMHRGLPYQNFGWAMTNLAHPAAPPMADCYSITACIAGSRKRFQSMATPVIYFQFKCILLMLCYETNRLNLMMMMIIKLINKINLKKYVEQDRARKSAQSITVTGYPQMTGGKGTF